MSSTNKRSKFDSDFADDINQILCGCNAETKPLFQTFVGKIRDRMQALQRETDELKRGSSTKRPEQKTAQSAAADDGMDSAKMISESTLIAAFDRIQGKVPKCKLRIEFYRDFLALISQSKHMEHDKVSSEGVRGCLHALCLLIC